MENFDAVLICESGLVVLLSDTWFHYETENDTVKYQDLKFSNKIIKDHRIDFPEWFKERFAEK